MKLTKENVKSLQGKSPLIDYVLDYVLDRWDDYDDKTAIFSEVLEHGCQSGIVSSLIYYSDTTNFFDNHKGEIGALLYEVMQISIHAPVKSATRPVLSLILTSIDFNPRARKERDWYGVGYSHGVVPFQSTRP